MRFNVRCARFLFSPSDYLLQYWGAVPPIGSISCVCADRSAFGCKQSEQREQEEIRKRDHDELI
jgi:hypothetical protein